MNGPLHAYNGDINENSLTSALTSDDAVTRMMARGAASEWVEGLTIWFNDELNRPKAQSTDLIKAFAQLQIQTFASLCSQLVDAGGYKHVARLYVLLTKDNMEEHMRRTAQAMHALEERAHT